MIVSMEELMDELWNIYVKCNRDTSTIYEVRRRELDKLSDLARIYFKGKIRQLVELGYLVRTKPESTDVVFSCRFTDLGREKVIAIDTGHDVAEN